MLRLPRSIPVSRDDRSELNRALAKALAYRIRNDPQRSQTWGAKLVEKLRAIGALK
jgi:hypothetical protein